MSTIAVVGAGPGLGFEIARVFGKQGFQVALIARNGAKLQGLVDGLKNEGVDAQGFAADVLNRPALRLALEAAAKHFGGIDVLEYSPSASTGDLTPVDVLSATPENTQRQVEFYLYGAMEAARAVLPSMVDKGAGTLLVTTGAGSVYPVPYFGNVTAAAAGLRNWALNLGGVVADKGVNVVHMAIGVWIGDSSPNGMPNLPAHQIAQRYWDVYSKGEKGELVIQG